MLRPSEVFALSRKDFADFDWLGVIAFGFIASLLLFPSPAHSEEALTTQLRAQGPQAYCTWWANQALFGARNVIWQSTREIRAVPRSETHRAHEYAEIIVEQEGYEELDQASRDAHREAVFFGYDAMKALVKATPAGQVDARQLAGMFYRHCLEKEGVGPQGARFQKVGTGAHRHETNCSAWANPAQDIMSFRHRMVPPEHVRIVLFTILLLPPEAQVRVNRIIDEAYVWPRGDEDFVNRVVELCQQGWPTELRDEQSQSDGGFVRTASSQRFYCDAVGAVAESMDQGFRNSEFRPEHIVNEHQRRIADIAVACSQAKQPIRECAIARCMARGT